LSQIQNKKRMIASRFLDPKNDVAFKKIFGSENNKDILIHFLNDILGFEGNGKIQNVKFLSTILDAEIASKKQSIVDVLCEDKNGKKYIVEMQVDPSDGFVKRAQYYAAKAYCSQLNRGKGADGQYTNLKEIIFIAISAGTLFKEKKPYISRHVVLDQDSHEHDLKDFSFTFIELSKFKKTKIEELENIVEKWCYFFKYGEEIKLADLDQLIGADKVIRKAYNALDQASWNEEELFAYDEELKRIWDNRAALDYQLRIGNEQGLAQGMEKGLQQGIEKGMAQGLEKGKNEGKNEKAIEIAKKMLAKNIDIDQIMELTSLTAEEIKKL
jgi:predicted transposase/invertase (TIGR01784 family)